MYKAGIDVGGTFTDVVVLNAKTGGLNINKVPTTPVDLSEGIVSGMEGVMKEVGMKATEMEFVAHATTVATNAILEKKGAKTALITTKGFRDVLEIRRQKRFDLYDLSIDFPETLVPRSLRREINERILYDGRIMKELDHEEVGGTIKNLSEAGVESIAVCLINSYINPKHEKIVGDIIEKEFPHICVSLSSDVISQWREYERTSTTVANAYVKPKVKRYLLQFEKTLKKLSPSARLWIMHSGGGIVSSNTAIEYPVRIVESGPAAGVMAASFIGRLTGRENVISFDMGGTTAKACLIANGVPGITQDLEVAGVRHAKGSGYSLATTALDLVEIGAGGGSIARVEMGTLKVGPRSAGAHPGPACYGLGGMEPTVTDADVVLGHLNQNYLIGGKLRIYPELSVRAIKDKVATPLKMNYVEAAQGICEVVEANMTDALRAVSVQRGHDPRMFTLVAFGGAGPVHASSMAEKLGIPETIVPISPGVISALGLLVADIKFDFVRTHLSLLDKLNFDTVNKLYSEMEASGSNMIKEIGVRNSFSLRIVDMRYEGQGYEILVPIPGGEITEKSIEPMRKAFNDLYASVYGYSTPEERIEAVNWRSTVISKMPEVQLKHREHSGTCSGVIEKALKERRRAYFPELGGYKECNVYDRYRLVPNASIVGPAIVEEKDSTVIIQPHNQAVVDDYGNLRIKMA